MNLSMVDPIIPITSHERLADERQTNTYIYYGKIGDISTARDTTCIVYLLSEMLVEKFL